MIWPRSQMFARIYRLYLQGLASFGPAQHISKVAPKANAGPSDNRFSRLSASEIDAKATVLGDTYRCISVSLGMLGIAIVFFAVAPVGLNIESEMWLRAVGVVKVVMMGVLFALVWRGSRTRLKVK